MTTAEKYVKNITRKIKCSKNKRAEIKSQLLSDIQAAQESGEPLDNIIKRMGKAVDVAEEFNENLPASEKSRYKKSRIIAVVIGAVFLVTALLAAFAYWLLPKTYPLGTSGIFTKDTVEARMKETVQYINEEDYAALKENALPVLHFLFNQESMHDTKKTALR